MLFRAPVETKVVKRKFKDQKDTVTTPDEDTAADEAADSSRTKRIPEQRWMRTPPPTAPPMQSTPPPRLTGAQQPQQVGWSLHRPPALPVVLPPALGAWMLRASGRLGW
jgi:hypothetical protein